MHKNLPPSKNYRWELLFWLWWAFFLNQADRAIFGVVLSEIKAELVLTDAQAGFIGSVLFWTLAILVPFAGYAGDIFSRRKIITWCLTFWSLATMATGLGRSVISLVFFRSVATGGGEAFYAPAASAMISQFHKKTRSLALSIHQTSLYAGVILSGFFGGWVADLWGWRAAFYIFGGFGVGLAVILAFRLKDMPKESTQLPTSNLQNVPQVAVPSLAQAVLVLLRTPTAMCITLAFTTIVFVNNGYMIWAPTFLQEKFNMSSADAGGFSMLYHHLFALIGVLIGGPLTDALVQKYKSIRLILQSACLLLGAPFIVLMGMGNTKFAIYVGMGGFGFFRGLFESNTYASLYDVIEPRLRSSASGVMIFFAFMAGAFSPWMLGELKPRLGLARGMTSLSIPYLLGATAILIALLFFFKKDYVEEDAS